MKEFRNIIMDYFGVSTGWVVGKVYFHEKYPSTSKRDLYILDISDCVRYGNDCLIMDELDIKRKIIDLDVGLSGLEIEKYMKMDCIFLIGKCSFVSTSEKWIELYGGNYESMDYKEWVVKGLLE